MIRFSDLWRFEGEVGRGPYAFWGLVLFGLKYNIDRIVVLKLTGEAWRPWDYFFGGNALKPLSAGADDPKIFFLLMAIALPFIWTGIVLTLRRLRGLGWPPWFVVFFFIPFLNLLFFLLLAVIPSRKWPDVDAPRGARLLDRIIPENALGSAVFSVLITAVLSAILVMGCTVFLQTYGWGLFVGIPF